MSGFSTPIDTSPSTAGSVVVEKFWRECMYSESSSDSSKFVEEALLTALLHGDKPWTQRHKPFLRGAPWRHPCRTARVTDCRPSRLKISSYAGQSRHRSCSHGGVETLVTPIRADSRGAEVEDDELSSPCANASGTYM